MAEIVDFQVSSEECYLLTAEGQQLWITRDGLRHRGFDQLASLPLERGFWQTELRHGMLFLHSQERGRTLVTTLHPIGSTRPSLIARAFVAMANQFLPAPPDVHVTTE